MTARQPVYFLPHGAGPCFFMDWDPPDAWDKMAAFLRGLPTQLPQKPRAIVVVSAHWETPVFTVQQTAQPDLIFDYSGFPPQTYALRYPAAGDPALAAHIQTLLQQAGLPTAADAARGYDHGVFIPLLVAFPKADIPVLQLSLQAGLDPAQHIQAGQALAALRDDNVLLLGSGMSYHNMRTFLSPRRPDDVAGMDFSGWLTATVTAEPAQRHTGLNSWAQAPGGRAAHPRAEHLLPLMVMAGAAGEDDGAEVFRDTVMGAAITAYRFG